MNHSPGDSVKSQTTHLTEDEGLQKDFSESWSTSMEPEPGERTLPKINVGDLPLKSDALTGQQLGRYKIGPLLGRGGASLAYKAYDEKLQRFVALKILCQDIGEWKERVLKEAQTQARVEHEHICRVYDVGDFDGTIYISMQYIEGTTLNKIAGELDLRTKVTLMHGIAEAVDAANRMGLVHRDIKPNNIMIEYLEDGKVKPYIMDFGLAREMKSSGESSFKFAGTPAYMAPEQARGELLCDHRADVYGLGATMYRLLGNRSPFKAANKMSLILKVAQEDPPPLRALNAKLPSDLCAIVSKAMAKEPEARYPSAHALADDLQRYLAGDPVKAIKPKLSYVLRKKITKNKLVSWAMGVAVLMVLCTIGVIVQNHLAAEERAELLQRFTQKVRGIEWFMRVNLMRPPHDIRYESKKVRQQVEEIGKEMNQLGALARGPGSYALGRGYMILENYKQAQAHLEAAIAMNFDLPEVQLAYGEVMGILYEQELETLSRIENLDFRRKQKRGLIESYRLPAVQALRRSARKLPDQRAYIHGLIAYYDEDFERAITMAHRAQKSTPWLFEAMLLEGKILLARAELLRVKGEFEAAAKALDLAGEALGHSMETARSDPRSYALELERLELLLGIEMKTGGSVQTIYDTWRRVGQTAILLNPDDVRILNRQAAFLVRWAEYLWYYLGESPQEPLARAVEYLQHSLSQRSDHLLSWQSLGRAYTTEAEFQMTRESDPGLAFKNAVDAWEKALKVSPNNPITLKNLGTTYWVKAEFEASKGNNPLQDLKAAISFLEKAIRAMPGDGATYNNLGLTLWTLAEYEWYSGQNPSDSFLTAISQFQEAIDRSNEPYAYTNLAAVLNFLAAYKISKELDPMPFLSKAEQVQVEAEAINADDMDLHLERGRTNLLSAKWALAQDQDPQPFFAPGERAYLKADSLAGKRIPAREELVGLYRLKAAWFVKEKRVSQARAALASGRTFLKDMKISPNRHAVGLAESGCLYLQEAQMLAPGPRRQLLAKQALDQLKASFDIRPKLRIFYEQELLDAKTLVGPEH